MYSPTWNFKKHLSKYYFSSFFKVVLGTSEREEELELKCFFHFDH